MSFSPHLEGCRGTRFTYGSPPTIGAGVLGELIDRLGLIATATTLLRDLCRALSGSVLTLVALGLFIVAVLADRPSSTSRLRYKAELGCWLALAANSALLLAAVHGRYPRNSDVFLFSRSVRREGVRASRR